MSNSNLVYKLMPKQLEFVLSETKETMFSGGVGAAKSMALCFAILKHLIMPNNSLLLLRKTLTSLRKTTLPLLINGQSPVLPKDSYNFNKTDFSITLKQSNSVLWMSGMEDPLRIRSFNAGAIFIDEAIEFSETEYLELMYRLRHINGTRQMFCVTNPASPSHFLYKRFFLENNPNRQVIFSRTQDNFHLPQDYLDSFKDLDPQRQKRDLEGQWISLDNIIFNNFNRNVNVIPYRPDTYEEYYCGIDWGQTHPASIIIVGKNKDRLTVLDEFCESNILLDRFKKQVAKFAKRYNPLQIYYDPSAPLIANELGAVGLVATRANNDVSMGLARIRQKFNIRNDTPDLVIHDKCTHLVRELENYCYKPNTEIPKKINDDSVDALRYVVNAVDDENSSPVRNTGPIAFIDEEEMQDDLIVNSII